MRESRNLMISYFELPEMRCAYADGGGRYGYPSVGAATAVNVSAKTQVRCPEGCAARAGPAPGVARIGRCRGWPPLTRALLAAIGVKRVLLLRRQTRLAGLLSTRPIPASPRGRND